MYPSDVLRKAALLVDERADPVGDAAFALAEFVAHDSRLQSELRSRRADTINTKRVFLEIPINRTCRRHGPNDANDPSCVPDLESVHEFRVRA